MTPKWNTRSWILFTLKYAYAKFALLWEVQHPKRAFLYYELRYSITNLINTLRAGTLPSVFYNGPDTLQTAGGIFRMRQGSHDAAIVSPAFERDDVHYLFRLLDRELSTGKSVGFLDIGANIGQFAVRVGRYSNGRALKTWAFEPIFENLELLRENLRLNSVSSSQVQVLPFALSSEDGVAEMHFSNDRAGDSSLSRKGTGARQSVQLRRADRLLTDLPTVVIAKIDVEGHEVSVLDGMQGLFAKSDRFWLCIEDIFEREALYRSLEKMGFCFQNKTTPYNSWWLLDKHVTIEA